MQKDAIPFLPHIRIIYPDGKKWGAVDNSRGNCWVEEFNLQSNARAYLNNAGIDAEDIYAFDAYHKAVEFTDIYEA